MSSSSSQLSSCTIEGINVIEDWFSPKKEGESSSSITESAQDGLKEIAKSHNKKPETPSLSAEINERIKYTAKMPGYSAIVDALKVLSVKGDSLINPETLDREQLASIASHVNAAPYVHFSGNCVLLSVCLLYNLLHNEIILGATNTFPIFKGIDSIAANMLIFGNVLKKINFAEKITSVEALENSILSNYKDSGEKYYTVEVEGGQVPMLGSIGHMFNAVVLIDKDGAAHVQFVDAWRTSNNTPSKEILADRYQNAEFSFFTL